MTEATTVHGTLPIILEGPLKKYGRKGELDSLSWKILATAETALDDLATMGFAIDSQLVDAGHSVWVDSIDETPESDLLTELSIAASGLIGAGDRRRRVISAGQREIAVGPTEKVVLAWADTEKGTDPDGGAAIAKVKHRVPKLDEDGEVVYKMIVTPSGSQERWNVKDSVLTVRDTYYATERPDTTIIGTADVPPNAPTPPPYLWGSYTEEKRANHPAGWVLEDRSIDEIHGGGASTNGLFATTDAWSYYYPDLPD